MKPAQPGTLVRIAREGAFTMPESEILPSEWRPYGSLSAPVGTVGVITVLQAPSGGPLVHWEWPPPKGSMPVPMRWEDMEPAPWIARLGFVPWETYAQRGRQLLAALAAAVVLGGIISGIVSDVVSHYLNSWLGWH